jgi:hypothetical protein
MIRASSEILDQATEVFITAQVNVRAGIIFSNGKIKSWTKRSTLGGVYVRVRGPSFSVIPKALPPFLVKCEVIAVVMG